MSFAMDVNQHSFTEGNEGHLVYPLKCLKYHRSLQFKWTAVQTNKYFCRIQTVASEITFWLIFKLYLTILIDVTKPNLYNKTHEPALSSVAASVPTGAPQQISKLTLKFCAPWHGQDLMPVNSALTRTRHNLVNGQQYPKNISFTCFSSALFVPLPVYGSLRVAKDYTSL